MIFILYEKLITDGDISWKMYIQTKTKLKIMAFCK